MKILCFGIAREIIGSASLELDADGVTSVASLKAHLEAEYPRFKTLSAYRIAVNQTFAESSEGISEADEIAIIPPVSGG